MNKKTIKLIVSIVLSLMLAVGAFVVADYFALFGTKLDLRLEFSEIRFRTLDEETGGIIMHVGVRCIQKGINNACTRRESHKVGVVLVQVPVQHVIKKTNLFKKEEEIVKTLDPKIHIMLIHQNYHSLSKTLLMEELYLNKVTEYEIKMTPRKWETPEDNE